MSVRTLLIASIASAMAAIITSQFWIRGTPIAAAVTPVIVTLVSELLHRPTQKIAERLTAETDALPRETDVLPEAAGAGPPPPEAEVDPRPARDPQPAATPPHETNVRRVPGDTPPAGGPAFEYRVYRASPVASEDLPWKAILLTAALAFVIAAAVLTLPELIAGESLGKGDGRSTLFGGGGGGGGGDDKAPEPTQTAPQGDPDDPAPAPQPEPDQTVPQPQPPPEETTPTVPERTTPPAQTTPAPRSATPPPEQ